MSQDPSVLDRVGSKELWPIGLAVLHIVENDFYPRDARVLNETKAMSTSLRCYVLAPRGKGQRFIESMDGVRVFRFPHFEASTTKALFVEYVIALFWIAVLGPLIVAWNRVSIVHVANPPDFVIPALSWLKLFGVRFVYDIHDLSVPTFRAKVRKPSHVTTLIEQVLALLAERSIALANVVIATNESIRNIVREGHDDKIVLVVRNSHRVRYTALTQVGKAPRHTASVLNVGYFGVLANDTASGLVSFVTIALTLRQAGAKFLINVVGDGPGLRSLQRLVAAKGLEEFFVFHGYVGMPQAYDLLKEFDFGLVTWPDLPKNHLHTAMKVMDYMCCAVPVCSLPLVEQVHSTGGIGIHSSTFEDIAVEMLRVWRNAPAYEQMREATLSRFNGVLSWEFQERSLAEAYRLVAR